MNYNSTQEDTEMSKKELISIILSKLEEADEDQVVMILSFIEYTLLH